jgi:hypothetical protein
LLASSGFGLCRMLYVSLIHLFKWGNKFSSPFQPINRRFRYGEEFSLLSQLLIAATHPELIPLFIFARLEQLCKICANSITFSFHPQFSRIIVAYDLCHLQQYSLTHSMATAAAVAVAAAAAEAAADRKTVRPNQSGLTLDDKNDII